MKYSFNSLQTGRSFRTNVQQTPNKNQPTSFNSLQTGRSFRTRWAIKAGGVVKKVSIPFKREGLSELLSLSVESDWTRFQFPSNGKVFPNASE